MYVITLVKKGVKQRRNIGMCLVNKDDDYNMNDMD